MNGIAIRRELANHRSGIIRTHQRPKPQPEKIMIATATTVATKQFAFAVLLASAS
jgi:hypothetical protein